MTFEEAMDYAASLPGVERSTYYGWPAAKANGSAFLSKGHEPETSFVLLIDRGSVALLLDTEPETYWQTPHYAGAAAVLVRYDTPDPDRVKAMIERARDQALEKNPPRPRKA